MPVTAPALKAMSRPRAKPLAGAVGDPQVRADRDVHADVAGGARQQRADEIADGNSPVEQQKENDGNDDADYADRRVLPIEVSGGAFLHRTRNLTHSVGAGAAGEHPFCGDGAVSQPR